MPASYIGGNHVICFIVGIVRYGRGIYPSCVDRLPLKCRQLARPIEYIAYLSPVDEIPAMEQWNSRVVGKRGHDHEIIVPYPAYTRVGMPTRDDGIIERIVVGKGIFPVKIVIAYVFEVIEFCYRTSLVFCCDRHAQRDGEKRA